MWDTLSIQDITAYPGLLRYARNDEREINDDKLDCQGLATPSSTAFRLPRYARNDGGRQQKQFSIE
jgi:hypothetical protein